MTWTTILFEISAWMSSRSTYDSSKEKDDFFLALMNRESVSDWYDRLILDWAEHLSLIPSDLSDDLRIYLIKQLLNEKKPVDDEAYRKIRQHCLNSLAATRWWACLTKNKQQKLRRLLRREDYAAAFDALLPFSDLWSNGMRFDVTKIMIGSKCDEVGQLFLRIVSSRYYQVAWNVSLSRSCQKILDRLDSTRQAWYAEGELRYDEGART